MNTFLNDLRYGARILMKNPGATLMVLLTLTLGIGANTAIFSVVNAVLLRPLPYQNPERLVVIGENEIGRSEQLTEASGPNFIDWKNSAQSFERMAAFEKVNFNLTGGDIAERVTGANISSDFFLTLGIAPTLGSTVFPEPDSTKGAPSVVLSNALWQRRFGGNQNIVGSTMLVNGEAATVAAVMPASFDYPGETEMWMLFPQPLNRLSRSLYLLNVVARLKPQVGLGQAQGEMQSLAVRLEQQYPDTNKGRGAAVASLKESITGDVRPALLLLLGTVGLVLLVACANIANLLLTGALARRREFAVRAALGARRGRLIAQLLTESLLLGVLGGAAGLLLGRWSLTLLINISPETLPRANDIELDSRVLLFTLAISLVTGLLFGLAPSWHALKLDLREALQAGGRTLSGGSQRLRSALVVVEIALALVVLVGAGLLIKSFSHLLAVPIGIDTNKVLTMRLELPEKEYKEESRRVVFYDQLLKRVKGLPGVESAGAVNTLPFVGAFMQGLMIEGAPPVSPSDMPITAFRVATDGYFRALHVPLRSGRLFDDGDQSNKPGVAIVDEATAQRFWPGADALGHRIRFAGPEEPWLTIVGVVGDVRYHGLDSRPFRTVYVPHTQNPFRGMMLSVRTTSDPLQSASAIRETIASMDRNIPVAKVLTLNQIMMSSVAQRQLNMSLLVIFALLALALAVVGIYGVLSQAVLQRRRELGIRMALGARASDVMQLIIKGTVKLALIGVAIGLIGAFALTRFMVTLLFAVTPTDGATFAIVALGLFGVALLAGYLPARRATKVDPVTALRYE